MRPSEKLWEIARAVNSPSVTIREHLAVTLQLLTALPKVAAAIERAEFYASAKHISVRGNPALADLATALTALEKELRAEADPDAREE